MKARPEDIQPICGGLERHFEARTLIEPGAAYFSRCRFLRLGDRLHVTRYVNETWTEIVSHRLADAVPILTGRDTETGFVIDIGHPSPLRKDGWFVFDNDEPPSLCREDDIAPVSDGMPFHQHYMVRTLAPLEEAATLDYLADVFDLFAPGDCLHIARFRNDEWRQITDALGFVRVDCDQLITTMPPQHFATRPDHGYTIHQLGNSNWIVKNNGAFNIRFGTRLECTEYVARATKTGGYDVHEDNDRDAAVVTHMGNEIATFPSMRLAWQDCMRRIAATTGPLPATSQEPRSF